MATVTTYFARNDVVTICLGTKGKHVELRRRDSVSKLTDPLYFILIHSAQLFCVVVNILEVQRQSRPGKLNPPELGMS
jgi:hypothetical protein